MGDVGGLTVEQRERITRNFKAAKLIRDRKRFEVAATVLSPATTPSKAFPDALLGEGGLSSSAACRIGHASDDVRTPEMKKMRSEFSHGIPPRKALTEVKQNIGWKQPLYAMPPPPFQKEQHRNVGSEFSNQTKVGENILSYRHDENRALFGNPTAGVCPPANHHELASSRQLQQPPLHDSTGSLGGEAAAADIVESLSQTFNEEMLKEIDALCDQRNLTKGSSRTHQSSLNVGSKPEPQTKTDQDHQHTGRIRISSALQGENVGLVVVPTDVGAMLPPNNHPLKSLHRSLSFLETSKENDPTIRHSLGIPGRSVEGSDTGLLHKSGGASSPPMQPVTAGASDNFNAATREFIEFPKFVSSETGGGGAAVAASRAESSCSHLEHLNTSQRNAATSDTHKPLLILAGPGSGKTSTMVARLVTLLKEGMAASNILAMTFTTAAATEMRERIAKAVGKASAKELAISTFHSFSLQLCRSHAEKLGRTSEFLVFGRGQQRKAVVEATRIALDERRVDDSSANLSESKNASCSGGNVTIWKDQAKKWQQFVTKAKSAGKTAEEFVVAGNVLGASVLRNYEKTLAACDALDYHDFIAFAVKLLREEPEVFEECQRQWTCILVDEFQDTSTMQHCLLRLLASHNRITVVGDDDQSIFGFNGASASGFDSFRKDFPNHSEVRLYQNYRSTKCIVEAAAALIRNNCKHSKGGGGQPFTENTDGERIQVRECRNEEAQCSLLVDYLLMNNNGSSIDRPSYGSTAVLYRRQVTGRIFQTAFRARKIPFNVHGVAFYRKKVIKNVIALLWTSIPGRNEIFSRRAFKSLYHGEKAEINDALGYIEKILKSKKYDFLEAAAEIFSAKVSGHFNRRQLTLGKKALASIRTLKHVVAKEQSLSAIIRTAANLLPQRPTFEKRAVVNEDGGKLLNEDDDPRTILEFLLDDVNDFLSNQWTVTSRGGQNVVGEAVDTVTVLKAFLDQLSTREDENFRCRREENKSSLTLTTMHQSKGLEWDTVFIVKVNDTETPLLHESLGCATEGSLSLEEERRLFYVAMTRARKKLYITYVVVDSQRQVLKPSRFLKELPRHLLDIQDEVTIQHAQSLGYSASLQSHRAGSLQSENNPAAKAALDEAKHEGEAGRDEVSVAGNCRLDNDVEQAPGQSNVAANAFLRRFGMEKRSVIAAIFHTWAKKPCFQDPKRLLTKVGFVIDERLRVKGNKNKDVLINLKLALKDEDALLYAQHVLAWERLPAEDRAVIQAERQEHFQQQNCERSLASATATPKQISYLRSLGCTLEPTSRLHASKLIEQYKRL